MKRKITLIIGFTIAIATIWLSSCQEKAKQYPTIRAPRSIAATPKNTPITVKKKVLYVDSYDANFSWVQQITNGMLESFNIKKISTSTLDQSLSPITLEIFHMDTKRNKSEDFKIKAGLKAYEIIKKWKPDLIIVSDDNATKYLVVPHLINSNIPIVFCGLNWDASIYGLPTKNITGMVEITLLPELVELLSKYSKGRKIGIIGSDTLSVRKDVSYCKKRFNFKFIERYANNFKDLKKKYLELQNISDIVIIEEFESVPEFNRQEMIDLILEKTSVPTGAMYSMFAQFAMITYASKGEEQGAYAAKTALKILNGKSPADIPIAYNKNAEIYLNMKLAKNIGITFPIELIEQASFVE